MGIQKVSYYTGSDLKTYINNFTSGIYEKRDFVNSISEYLQSPIANRRIMGISGLRGTGKTVGILQVIKDLNNYDNSLYIILNEEIEYLEFKSVLFEISVDKTYIFIDEITRVKGLIDNISFLADNLLPKGKRVIVSGTDSLALLDTVKSSLYHRIVYVNVTHISYPEIKRTMGQSFKEYLEIGGLYSPDAIKDFEGMRDYVNTAILDNIESSFNRNNDLVKNYGLEGIISEDLRLIIFMILYAVVYSTANKIRRPNIKRIIKMFDISVKNTDQSIEALRNVVFNDLNISTTLIPTESQVNAILSILERIGILVKTQNFYDTNEKNYYITNPSITSQIYYSIYSSIKSQGLESLSWASLKPVLGYVFESIIVVHTVNYSHGKGYNVYYYRDKENREIDLLIENERESENIFNPYYCYFEIKMTSDANEAIVKSKWVNDEEILLSILQNGDIVGSGIIYGGDNEKVFMSFDREMYSSGNTSKVEIEKKNNGTYLIPCEKYILNTEKYLNILE